MLGVNLQQGEGTPSWQRKHCVFCAGCNHISILSTRRAVAKSPICGKRRVCILGRVSHSVQRAHHQCRDAESLVANEGKDNANCRDNVKHPHLCWAQQNFMPVEGRRNTPGNLTSKRKLSFRVFSENRGSSDCFPPYFLFVCVWRYITMMCFTVLALDSRNVMILTFAKLSF